MNKETEALQSRFLAVAKENHKFCFITRAIELQEGAVSELNKIIKEAIALKVRSVEANDEDSANALLAIECMADTLASELSMWGYLKTDKPYDAWRSLIRAQSSLRSGIQAHPIGLQFEPLADRLYLIEQLLFPPPIFFSTGMIIERSQCSICNEEYGSCNHIKGKAYMGKLCSRIVIPRELTEVSIVQTPADKLCIAEHVGTAEQMRDWWTWRVVPKK